MAAQVDKSVIEAAFDFVRDDCSLAILAPHSQIGEYVRLIESLPEDSSRLGEILVACGALTAKELAEALVVQELKTTSERIEAEAAQTTAQPKPLGEILVTQKLVQPEVVGAALEKQLHVRDTKAHESRVIRVDATKLDQLINLVGELVIAGAGASLLAGRSGDSALQESTALISRLVEEIRDTALRLRMVQIGETFNRFHRVVRDVSKELGKDIELVISGGRNRTGQDRGRKDRRPAHAPGAQRHGPRHRAARGACRQRQAGERPGWPQCLPRLGQHRHRSRRRRRRPQPRQGSSTKAIERGLVSATASLSDHEIYKLIFEPGFSTAEQVSNLSGRGVGMDVVRRNIEALRGTVELDSQSRPGHDRAHPSAADAGDHRRIPGRRRRGRLRGTAGHGAGVRGACRRGRDALAHRGYINLRGEVLPLLRLREHFEFTGASPRRENIVVVHYAGQKAGLVVDELMGEFQTVIKPLGKLFSRIKGIAGSTILGTGEVALILDVPSLVQQAAATEAGLSGMPERAATLVH